MKKLARASLTLALGAAPALGQGELYELHGSSPSVGGFQGRAVATDGIHIVVGAPWEKVGGVVRGAAYVFDLASGVELHRLVASDGVLWDAFGSSVAVGGGLVVVGAYQHDAQGDNSGAAYVFELATGNERAKLTAPDATNKWWMGFGVGVDASVIAVGAPMVETGPGRVYLYDPQTFALAGTLAPTGNPGYWDARFGAGIDVDAGRIAVGAYLGAQAWVFDAASSAVIAKVSPHDADPLENYFGRTLDLEGDLLLVGASVDDERGQDAGAAYAFELPSGNERFKLAPAELDAEDDYGSGVAIEGELLIVGARFDDDGAADGGAVWIHDATTGLALGRITASDAATKDLFGTSVAAAGGRIVAGADGDDDVKTNAGSAYVHAVPMPVGTAYCTPAVPNSTGLPATIEAIGSEEVALGSLYLVARRLPTGFFGLFLVSATADHVPFAGGSQGTLCLGGTIGRFNDQPQSSGSIGAIRAVVDLDALPPPIHVAVQPGDTWNFQAWFRDKNPQITSNFTDGVAVTFF